MNGREQPYSPDKISAGLSEENLSEKEKEAVKIDLQTIIENENSFSDAAIKAICEAKQRILSCGSKALPFLKEQVDLVDRFHIYDFSNFASALADETSTPLLLEVIYRADVCQNPDASAISNFSETLVRVAGMIREKNPDDPNLEEIYRRCKALYENPETTERSQQNLLYPIAATGLPEAREFVDKQGEKISSFEQDRLNLYLADPRTIPKESTQHFYTWEEILEERQYNEEHPDYFDEDYYWDDWEDLEFKDEYRKFLDTRLERDGEDYEFFRTAESRQELIEITANLCQYLHNEQIPDLILVDRSARPVYITVLEYWKKTYPNEKPPQIYFINPKGFKTIIDVLADDLSPFMHEIGQFMQGDLLENPLDDPRTPEQITEDFLATYRRLIKDVNKPVLIFDTCIHSGDSLRPVLRTMKETGFTDVRVGVVSVEINWSGIEPDFIALYREPVGLCKPFDHDFMTNKTFESASAVINKDPESRERSIRLRKEIKQIVKELL